jgi:hypothetical protein
MKCIAVVTGNDENVLFLSIFPGIVPTNRRAACSELLTRINSGGVLGWPNATQKPVRRPPAPVESIVEKLARCQRRLEKVRPGCTRSISQKLTKTNE